MSIIFEHINNFHNHKIKTNSYCKEIVLTGVQIVRNWLQLYVG